MSNGLSRHDVAAQTKRLNVYKKTIIIIKLTEANIKILFVSPNPTLPARCGSVGREIIIIFFSKKYFYYFYYNTCNTNVDI